jgi:ATP phosphoribosyltransferase regulatory subunit
MPRWLLPEGIADVLPDEAQRIEHLRRALLDLYRVHGYELVIPPLIEYLDSLLTGTGHDLDLQTFKLVDQLSGRQLGLRADITPQTARIDAHILNRPGVVRLCYAGSVLHTRPMHPLASRQPLQVGAELYGCAGIGADAEVQSLAVASLRLAGVTEICIDFGHTGVVRALLAADPAAGAAHDEILSALATKDVVRLGAATEGVGAAVRDALNLLATLHGAPDVLERARVLLPALEPIGRALDELQWLVDRIEADRISIDLADLHGYRYYTGVNFAAYDAGWAAAVLRGGRYDDIGRAFGRARPATGFSLDLRDLSRRNGAPMPRAILAPDSDERGLGELVKRLRAQGEIVIRQMDDAPAQGAGGADREIRRVDGQWRVVPLGQAEKT